MDRNTIQKILIGLFISACIFIGLRLFNVTSIIENTSSSKPEISTNSSSSRMTYGRFLEYLELGWVKQVDLYDNSRNAIVLVTTAPFLEKFADDSSVIKQAKTATKPFGNWRPRHAD